MKLQHEKCRISMAFMAMPILLFFFLSTAVAGPPEGKGPPDKRDDSAGNNLSYPVIWSDGIEKTLPGTPGMVPELDGPWWYQWGTNGADSETVPASCPPDPDEMNPALNPEGEPYCDDTIEDALTKPAGEPPADNPLPLVKAYLQKETTEAGQYNVWQAASADWSDAPVNIDWIDWGDNLESVDWYTRSQVRIEVVLFQDLDELMLEYAMRHTSGWGSNEVHGLAVSLDDTVVLGPGNRSTVYSPCARLTIQKLNVPRETIQEGDLLWVPKEGWSDVEVSEEGLVNPPIFNMAVYEGGDGPGYYSAETNVKGRVIYGYTWNVRKNNEGPADYRITFSFDEECGPYALNTRFVEDITQILVPVEKAPYAESDDAGAGGGADGVLVCEENLTYMDIRILDRTGGGGGGKGGGKRGPR